MQRPRVESMRIMGESNMAGMSHKMFFSCQRIVIKLFLTLLSCLHASACTAPTTVSKLEVSGDLRMLPILPDIIYLFLQYVILCCLFPDSTDASNGHSEDPTEPNPSKV